MFILVLLLLVSLILGAYITGYGIMYKAGMTFWPRMWVWVSFTIGGTLSSVLYNVVESYFH